MKRIINISLWMLSFAALIVLVGFVEKEHKKITCKSLEVLVEYNGADPLIDIHTIKEAIYASFDTLIGRRISDINLVDIEKLVQKNKFIDYAQVYYTLTGHLKIRVIQNQPLVRIINQKNESYYLDVKGRMVPIRHGFPTRLLVASGNLPYSYSDTLGLIKNENFPILKDIHKLALYIKNNEFLDPLIEQVYVNQENDFELIPKVGRQVILFGDIGEMEDKFARLEVFYKYGMGKAGWNTYRTINLKFSDQVVCAKKL